MANGTVAAIRKRNLEEIVLGLLPFVVFFAAFLALLAPIQLRGASDDTAHITELQQMGVWQWVVMRTQTWQPRLASDFAFAVLLPHLRVWKVLNAGVMALLLWMVTRTALFGDQAGTANHEMAPMRWRFLTLAVFVCPLLFLIHPNVITSGSVWFTGSFYYLWPVTALFIGLSPALLALYDKRLPTPYILLPVCQLFSLGACFTEQTSAVQVGVLVLVIAWFVVRHERVPRFLITQFVLVLAVTAVFFYLDFTSPRQATHAELQLFPEFAGFSMFDKLTLGVNVYTTHLLHISNILFTVLAVFAGWLAYRRAGRGILRLLAFLPGLWALINTLPLPWGYTSDIPARLGGRPSALGFGKIGWLGYLESTTPLTDTPAPGTVVLSVLAVLCVMSMFWLLVRAFPDVHDRYLAVVLYLASFMSGILIGFSPTVWASGSRPNFLSDFLLLLLIVMLLRTSMVHPTPESPGFSLRRSWAAKVGLALLLIFAVFAWYLYHTVFATNVYWWY